MTVVQLGPGAQSAAEELTSIHDARSVHESSALFNIGLTFSDPDYLRGVIREKELLGRKDEFGNIVNAAANSWQAEVGLQALSAMPGGGFMVKWTFALHEFAQSGNIYPVIGGLLQETFDTGGGGMSGLAGMAADKALNAGMDRLMESREPDEGLENCFLAGTQVAMADGSEKAIEDVASGDQVAAADPARGWQGVGKVAGLFRNVTGQVAYVTFAEVRHQRGRGERHSVGAEGEDGEDGEPPPAQTVRCTPHHPWWVANEGDYISAGTLQPGDRLRLQGGGEGLVLRIDVRAERAWVFNFEVPGWHTYFAASGQGECALVHNGGKARKGSGTVYVTYTKKNEAGVVYVGRARGPSTMSPKKIVARRDRKHHMTAEGFGPAKLDVSSRRYAEIRGREHLLIREHGGHRGRGAPISRGRAGNTDPGISDKNPKKREYIRAAMRRWDMEDE